MSPYQQQKSKKHDGLAGFILIGGAVILIFFAAFQEESVITIKPSDKAVSAFSKEAEGVVNHHLLSTNRKVELEQQIKRNENYLTAPKIGDQATTTGPSYYQPKGVVMGTDRKDARMLDDASRRKDAEAYQIPSNQIQREIAEQQSDNYYREMAQQEYARQFVENAKKDGWAIELDEGYVVKSVKRIRPDTKPRLFAPSSNGSR